MPTICTTILTEIWATRMRVKMIQIMMTLAQVTQGMVAMATTTTHMADTVSRLWKDQMINSIADEVAIDTNEMASHGEAWCKHPQKVT